MQEGTSSVNDALSRVGKDVSSSRDSQMNIELESTGFGRDAYDKGSSASSGMPGAMPEDHELQPTSSDLGPPWSQQDDEPHRSKVRVVAIMVALSVSFWTSKQFLKMRDIEYVFNGL